MAVRQGKLDIGIDENVIDKEDLKLAYKELCVAHHGIAEFRAKLLALLPIASGTGIFILLTNLSGEPASSTATTSGYGLLMTAIGLIGFFLVAGLYLYELRGIQRCAALSLCGAELEQHFLGAYKDHGVFSGEPKSVSIATNTWAALIIYSTMAAGWAFIAFTGFFGFGSGRSVLLSVVAGIILLIAGFLANKNSHAILMAVHKDCTLVQEKRYIL